VPCEASPRLLPLLTPPASSRRKRFARRGRLVDMSADAERPASVQFGRFLIIRHRRELLIDGRPAELGGRAFDTLMVLIDAAGAIVDKDALMRAVWPDRVVEEHNLHAQVSALRKVFGSDRSLIQTVAGRGYRFAGVVREAETANAAPASRLTNLPASLSELIGRDAALQTVMELVTARRLVTLTGTGGVGKTRLATEAARALLPRYPDGVWFVDLGPIADPELVAVTAASAVGIPLGGGPVTTERVAAAVAPKAVLVILDNCEHVIGAAAALARSLVVGGPLVRVLATSREPLRVADEHVYRVPSLDVPAENNLDMDDVARHGAVQLFTARARAVAPAYEVDRRRAPTAAAICRRLDGIPLAIELAAARVAALGIEGVAAKLDDRFRLLTGGQRTALARQQTLRATLDWSYELLTEAERVVIRRLAVFAGMFSLDAAIAVVAGGGLDAADVLDCMASLVDRSLVVAHGGGGAVQYRLLETTRGYAREKLGESGESDGVLRRHAEHLRDVLEGGEREWETRSTSEWLAEYSPWIDDVRAALDWAFSPGGDSMTGAMLAIGSAALWLELSLLEECRERLEQARTRLTPGALPARLEMKLSAAYAMSLQNTRGPRAETDAVWAGTLEVAERLGDDEYRMRALWGLYACRNQLGSGHVGLALARRLADIAATQPDTDLRAIADRMIGTSLHYIGDQRGARRHIEQMLASHSGTTTRSHRLRFLFDQRVMAQVFLTHVAWLQGEPDKARSAAARAVADARAAAHHPSLCFALAEAEYAVALYTGDLAALERAVSELVDVGKRDASVAWQAAGRCMHGLVLVKRGDANAHARVVRPALDQLGEARYFFHYTGFLAALADGLGQAGRTAEGRAVIEEAFTRCDITQECWSMPELLRVKGELLRHDGALNDAEDHFRRGLEYARSQEVAGWELRAATSLARLWHAQQRTRQARTLLLPVYRRFTEGLKTADLLNAKALLDTLRL
jgi:predicted ATPase/DNA-binding winged helix-turn-helix (wHTH) protein